MCCEADAEVDFCKWTEELWRIYFSLDENSLEQVLEYVDEDCSVIGTEAHEFYGSLREFLADFAEEMRERGDVAFQWRDFWCEQKRLSPDICLVYGKIRIFWESPEHGMTIDVDSRFSVVYCLRDGIWKIVHMHQSIPYKDQIEGGYDSKPLSEQVWEVQRRVKEMARLAEMDGLTGLFNFRALKQIWDTKEKENLWFFLLDVDDFKEVNDTCGHIAGNQVLKNTAEILRVSVRSKDVVCRMGGDEFILLCSDLSGEREVCGLAERLLRNMSGGRKAQEGGCRPTVSIGITRIREGEELEAAMERADQALYRVKKEGKNDYSILL